MREAWISGAAMTRFGRHVDRSARELVEEAVAGALRDAGVEASAVRCAYVGNAASGILSGQESIRGQVVLRRTGLMGTPIVNVENADASGSTALHLAWQAVAAGMHDCVLVVGYEKLDHVDRVRSFQAVNATMDLTELADVYGPDAHSEPSVLVDLYDASPVGAAGERFTPNLLAEVSVKNHHHGALNPCAHYREEFTVERVLGSRVVAGPLTRLMCAPFSDGAACVVLRAGDPSTSRSSAPAVRIAASVLGSGRGDDLRAPLAVIPATREAYERAAVGPEDLDVVELHDATTISELLVYERLGLCPDGEAERLIRDRTTWLGGGLPVNPSGGLLARGHPHGATGVAQVVELVWQLRGGCGARQVPSARVALAQNTGGWVGTDVGAVCVHVLTV
jgi:acetyl-CoA acetyltransferase